MITHRSAAVLTVALLTACGGADEPAGDGGPGSDADSATTGTGITMPSTDIWVADLRGAGRELTLDAPENVTDRAGYDNQPAFLADGSFLYTREEAGATDIWRFDPATGTHQQVTRTPESEYSPTPVPEGGTFSVIQVEADGTQRLWEFDMAGGNPSVVFPDVEPVGYHAWVDGDHAFLFILGDPPTLHEARRGVAGSTPLAEGIGPSIQGVPGQPAVSFVEVTEVGTEIETWTAGEALSTLVTPGVDGAVHHAWTPEGVLLQASGNTVYAFLPDGEGWLPVGTLPADQVVTRLAVSADGARLALVAEAAGTG